MDSMMGDGYTAEHELRLVLVGKGGVGKSATANTIVGEKKFDSKACSTPADRACRKEAVNWKRKKVVVVDTPGFFDTEHPHELIFQEIRKCITMSSPGPHAIVLVVKVGRYTEEDKKSIERIQDTFGKQAARYMIVVFTRKDDLEEVPIQDYVSRSRSKDLQELIQMCGNRYCAFNNRARAEERGEQVHELLTMIDRMVEENKGIFYTLAMYDQAQKILLEKIEQLRRQNKGKIELEKEKLMQQFKEHAKKMHEEEKLREEEMRKENVDLEKKIMKRGQNNAGIHLQPGRETKKTKYSGTQQQTSFATNVEKSRQDKATRSEARYRYGKANDEQMPKEKTPHYNNSCINVNSREARKTTCSGPMMGGQYTGVSELRLVLVGKTGVGKSASGNTILGEKKFDSSACSAAVDKTCRKEMVNWRGRNVVIVDTPGFFDTELPHEQIVQEGISKCVTMSSPGPHAIVLVVRVGRYTEEEKKTIERILDTFGERAARYMIVLFTRKDDLEEVSIHDYLRRSGSRDLQELIQTCVNRYCAFNNRASTEERGEQVNELLTMIDRMVEQNNGTCYTNEMYRQAEKMHREKLEAQKAQQIDPLEVERQRLARLFEEKREELKGLENKNDKEPVQIEYKQPQLNRRSLDAQIQLQDGKKRTTEIKRNEKHSQSFPGRHRVDPQDKHTHKGQIYAGGRTTENKRGMKVTPSFPGRPKVCLQNDLEDELPCLGQIYEDTSRGNRTRGEVRQQGKAETSTVGCFSTSHNRHKEDKKDNKEVKTPQDNERSGFRRLFQRIHSFFSTNR